MRPTRSEINFTDSNLKDPRPMVYTQNSIQNSTVAVHHQLSQPGAVDYRVQKALRESHQTLEKRVDALETQDRTEISENRSLGKKMDDHMQEMTLALNLMRRALTHNLEKSGKIAPAIPDQLSSMARHSLDVCARKSFTEGETVTLAQDSIFGGSKKEAFTYKAGHSCTIKKITKDQKGFLVDFNNGHSAWVGAKESFKFSKS